jgi:hypothetical protein
LETRHGHGQYRTRHQVLPLGDAVEPGAGDRHREGGGSLRRSGYAGKAVETSLDVEQLVCEVNTLLNAASLINRPSGN